MDNSLVVFDPGSKTFKAGLSSAFPSEEEPRIVTPNAVEVHGSRDQPGETSGSGAKHVDVIHPIEHGAIKNMDALEALIHYSLYDMLGWEIGTEGSVLFSEPLLTSKRERELLTQIMFEVFNVYGLYLQDPATLSLYALGKLTGCVVDIGHGKIDVATVTDGQLIPTSVRRLPFSGEDLNAYMTHLLASGSAPEGAPPFPASLTPAQAESLKEQCSLAADSWYDYSRFTGRAGASSAPPPPQTYHLPDGQAVTIGSEGYEMGEVLVSPGPLLALLEGRPGARAAVPGLADVMAEVQASALELVHKRAGHLENIVVVGGGGQVPGLPQRLVRELQTQVSCKVGLAPVPEYLPGGTRFAPWLGGAVLAKVLASQSHFVSKGEYEEWGPSALNRKCG